MTMKWPWSKETSENEASALYLNPKRHEDIELCLITLGALEEEAKERRSASAVKQWGDVLHEADELAIQHRDKEFMDHLQKKRAEWRALGMEVAKAPIPGAPLKQAADSLSKTAEVAQAAARIK